MTKSPDRDALLIGELAAETGLSPDTLRYYERAGLMRDPVPRNGSGQRIYRAGDARWVEFITKLRSSGMPIGMIRRYTELARAGESSAPDRLALLEEHRRGMRRRLDDLQQALDVIDHKIALYRRMGDGFMIQQTRLGTAGPRTGVIGLGCMGMSAFYTGAGRDEAESIRTIRRAVDLGATMIDTAEVYGPYTNEELVGRALRGIRDRAVIATKFGMLSHPAGGIRRYDGRPENVRRAVEGSLRRLGVEHIDLYYQHRQDPSTPIEETVGTLAELIEEGTIGAYGLSEVDARTIRRAHAVHPVTAVQTEYSLWSRDVESEVLPVLRELGITLVPYSPLGRGFLTGRIRDLEGLDRDDFRRGNPPVHARCPAGEPAHRRAGRAGRSRARRDPGPGRSRLAARQEWPRARHRAHPRHPAPRQTGGEPGRLLGAPQRRADRPAGRAARTSRRPLPRHAPSHRYRAGAGRALTPPGPAAPRRPDASRSPVVPAVEAGPIRPSDLTGRRGAPPRAPASART